MTAVDLRTKAETYRQRAEELFAMAHDFEDPQNRKAINVLAEEYIAMAARLEDFSHSIEDSPKK